MLCERGMELLGRPSYQGITISLIMKLLFMENGWCQRNTGKTTGIVSVLHHSVSGTGTQRPVVSI